jgi:5-deoxy-glucuronate isomerase
MHVRYRDYHKVDDEWVKVFEDGYFRLSSIATSRRVVSTVNAANGEALLFALRGSMRVNGVSMGSFDVAYLPRGMNVSVELEPNTIAYLAESWAEGRSEFYVKRREMVKPVVSGVPPYERRVYTMIGEGDSAYSFLMGYTEGATGNWTSYPPHRHDGKPEAYIFYGIDPGFAVQLVLSEDEEKAYVVHDFDVVLIRRGYHPNVASTINSVNYAWVIAAPRGQRTLSVNMHPLYSNLPMGQTHLRLRG